ncbi:MAG: LysM peptidoglycan-binding domain-containing protein [Flavobacteriales bacterium]|nr:LysM peptidoglycan-binding domain-containing protein [Flavobacteriales bacterium]MCB9448926.1 LysM peptidoglycan-binding domain-containing protein [Flavobacteriales bacterium]
MSRIFVTCGLLCVSAYTFGQQPEWHEGDTIQAYGKTAVVRKVEKGLTLYSLSKKHHVEIEEILDLNPRVRASGLQEDQLVLIPIPQKVTKAFPPKKEPEKPGKVEGYSYHEVAKGETMYSLAKQYDLTVDELTMENPIVQQQGLKAGMELRIPVHGKGGKEGDVPAIEPVVSSDAMNMESMDSIPMPPVDSGALKLKYTVSLLLPLYLDLNDSTEARMRREPPAGEMEDHVLPQSRLGLEFYQGVLMASDSVSNANGIGFNLKVYDTENDTNVVKKLVRQGALDSTDLVIGPMYENCWNTILPTARRKHVDVVSPFAIDDAWLAGMPHAAKLTTPAAVHVRTLGKLGAAKYSHHKFIVVYLDRDGDRELKDEFRHALYTSLPVYRDSSAVNYKEVNYSKEKIEGVRSQLSAKDTNVVVFLSKEYSLVSDLISKLNYSAVKTDGPDIILFGMPNWKGFDNIDVAYLQNLFVHIPSSYHVDYSNPAVTEFMVRFRDRFHTDPSNYAFLGYDVAMFFLERLATNGVHACTTWDQPVGHIFRGLQTGFQFTRKPGYGVENGYTHVYLVNDFELKDANVFKIHPPEPGTEKGKK